MSNLLLPLTATSFLGAPPHPNNGNQLTCLNYGLSILPNSVIEQEVGTPPSFLPSLMTPATHTYAHVSFLKSFQASEIQIMPTLTSSRRGHRPLLCIHHQNTETSIPMQTRNSNQVWYNSHEERVWHVCHMTNGHSMLVQVMC